MRLRSMTRHSKMGVLGRKSPNGVPQMEGRKGHRKNSRDFKFSFALPALQITFVDFFFEVACGFSIENNGDFWCFFVVSVPQEIKHESPWQFWGKFGAKSGAKVGTKIRTIRGTFVLQRPEVVM